MTEDMSVVASGAPMLVRQIDTGDFGGKAIRIGDLNGDGALDFLVAQSIYGTRQITCLTALTAEGQVLWQQGEVNRHNALHYSDLPFQIFDWDDDGRNEVLYISQAGYAEVENPELWYRERALRYEGTATLHVLDAATGVQKREFPLPAPADDSFLFADLTGRGRRGDLIVKDRYWNLWGVSHEGEVLWHWEGNTGHYPAIADLDGDGRDEVFVGYALLDHDGTPLWELEGGKAHSDANAITQLPDGQWRLLFGNGGVHCLNVAGEELWYQPVHEAQHVLAGRFCSGLSPFQVMAIDRGAQRGMPQGRSTLLLFDGDGHELWRREQPPGSWCANFIEVDWSGHGEPREVLVTPHDVALPVEIINGAGEIVASFEGGAVRGETQDPRTGQLVMSADVYGDGRDEAIVYDTHSIRIYANTRPFSKSRQYNHTLYRGM